MCTDADCKPLVCGIANALGIDSRKLWEIVNDKPQSKNKTTPDSLYYIKLAYSTLKQLWESYMSNGKINPASSIFLGKNHYGYRDVQEYMTMPENILEPTMTKEQIEKTVEQDLIED